MFNYIVYYLIFISYEIYKLKCVIQLMVGQRTLKILNFWGIE